MSWFRRDKRKSISPAPPVNMTDEEFREAQRRYIDKHEKLVKPDHGWAIELTKMGVEYGKLTVTYLVVGNAGGLAALLALYPFMREGNSLWLVQQLPVAVAYVIGLFIAVAVGAFAYLSFAGGALTRWNIAHHNAIWIARPEFGTDHEWSVQGMADHFRQWKLAERISAVSSYVAVGLALVSGICWSAGTVLLATHLARGASLT